MGIDNLSFSASILPVPVNIHMKEISLSVPVKIQISGANLFLNWPGAAGQRYQLEYKDDLTALAWMPLGNPVTGAGGTLTLTNHLGASSQRYFRLRLVK